MGVLQVVGGATLEELLQVDGVAIAFEFSPDGTLKDFRAREGTPRELTEMAAQLCASVTMMFNTLAHAFTRLSDMRWTPQQGWGYVSEEWSCVIGGGGYRGVLIETGKADFSKLYQMLVGTR